MQPSDSGYEWKVISAIGTAALRAIPSVLHIVLPEVSTGTVTLFDANAVASTATANQIINITGGTSVQDCFPRTLDIQCENGLVYRALGTPVVLLSVS